MKKQCLVMLAGMIEYLEPQCLRDQRYKCDEMSDIYSLGVIFWEISSGRPPFCNFENRMAIIMHILNGNRETPVENTPDDYVKLYQRCWDQEPEKRPEIKAVLEELNMQFPLIDDQKAPYEKWIETKIIEGRINKYNIDEFEDYKLINNGTSNKVYRVRFKNTNNIYALKLFKKNDYTNKEIINELECMISVESHENIIKFHGITYIMNKMDANVIEYGLILEYADNGTLRNYLHKNLTKIEWGFKIQFAIQLVEAVKWLHTHNIVHGHLHPNNILIHGEILKLADFGLSQRVIETSMSPTSSEIFGIIPYIDPQCFRIEPNKNGNFRRYRENENEKSDIYSVGVILWEISSGRQPFENEDPARLLARIRNGLREEPTANTPHAYVTIYKRCWQSMQYDRPSIEDLAKALKDFKDFIDRYITANDKISHISTPYREKIISTPHMEEINILLLGEVGSGKSTFINAFANYFKFNSLDDAISGEIDVLISSTFTITNEDYETKTITVVCDEDEHDMVDNVGESSTQVCGVYVFHAGNSVIRLIDTPGIGDTRGIEYDKKNFENILQNISQHKYLNGICILLKPNNSRLNITFKFCIQELLSHLHKSAKDNIVFCFTNTRGTFFRPGDTLPVLKRELWELKKKSNSILK
ncbi:kinase-like domain-containing protein [Gigaspora rosea]|uniref:Kinase-like domain-containing protein n=1 Tax=Gigaspora rosea TaxID=44941 RepID=A0A397W194_9GLOM|nr:kinase-like domain-containing protein [Gigaspora rosea]